ncbi:hypothetical protein Ate01nite_41300 [Actinoplanes teichomyceticus]|nr:hypothetical protein Ate01nite_41300 [Actinoplanes teichomyceticus]
MRTCLARDRPERVGGVGPGRSYREGLWGADPGGAAYISIRWPLPMTTTPLSLTV